MEKPAAILTPNPVLPNHVIKIDPNKCVACYQCADICRCNVIMPNAVAGLPPVLVYPDECWHCAVCTENCPTGAIEFEHPINQKITWKRKATGEMFRIGMKNPPPPYKRRACGDRNIYLDPPSVVKMQAVETERVARYVVRAKFKKLEGEIPYYRPGSFCNVRIGSETWRGYSMSNPYDGEGIELFIDIFPGGPGSKFFEALTSGDIAEITVPFGRFQYVPKKTPVLLVGSVTGIAPIKAIVEEELLKAESGRQIHVVFQIWSPEDVFLSEYFDGFAHRFSNFTWELVCACNPKDGLKVDQHIAGLDMVTPEIDAYICASKPVVKAVEKVLLQKGVFWRNVFYESFIK